jgi:phosphate transport system substrate-binding protein
LDVNANGQVEPDELVETKMQAVDAVATDRYPSPPARPLYLVTKGKPTSATLDLISWILADGQKFVDAAGYVKLSEEQLLESQAQLK